MSKNRPKRTATPKAGRAKTETPLPERDETDRFIEEVTEELQRDKLYAQFRKWGPYALSAIVVMVGVAAYTEYDKAQTQATQRTQSDAFAQALAAEDQEAALLSFQTDARRGYAVLAGLRAAEVRASTGDLAGAATLYDQIAEDRTLPARYRDLATVKSVMARFETEAPDVLTSTLLPLTVDGAPYRTLALELRAVLFERLGRRDDARRDLQEIISQPGVPGGAMRRASALLDGLGGPLEDQAVPNSFTETQADVDARMQTEIRGDDSSSN
ncbi:MAG: tetratricopeptide repeat protein [Pseudomonadota bacterium]